MLNIYFIPIKYGMLINPILLLTAHYANAEFISDSFGERVMFN